MQETPKESDGPSYRFKAAMVSKSPFIQVPSRTAMWKWEMNGMVYPADSNDAAGTPARVSGSAGAEFDQMGHKFKSLEFEWNPLTLIDQLKLARTSPSSSIESASSVVMVTTPKAASSAISFNLAPLASIAEEQPNGPDMPSAELHPQTLMEEEDDAKTDGSDASPGLRVDDTSSPKDAQSNETLLVA